MTKRDQKAQETKDAYDKALASKDKALEDANKAHQEALAKLEKDYQDKLAQKEADAQKAREACQKAHAEKDAKIDSLTKELAKEKSRILATRHVDKDGNDIFPPEINKTNPKKDYTEISGNYVSKFKNTTVENGIQIHHYDKLKVEKITPEPTDHL